MRRRKSLSVVGVVAIVAGIGAAPGVGTGGATSKEEAVVVTEYFSFHSDPWINLHHFLYQWARAEGGLASGRQEVVVPEREAAGPAGDGALVWAEALDFYAENVAARGHFDEQMLELKAGLLELGGDPGAESPDDIAGIAKHLVAAMPVYLETWWSGHNRANRSWIDRVSGDVEQYEQRWVETISRAFGGSWLNGRLRVDASAYGNWAGGYTSNGPAHAVLWSTDPTNNTGLYGLELIFHESGHMSPLGAPLRATTREIMSAAGVEEPANLRHAMLFATAGEFVRAIARERGLPEHVPYVVAEGLVGFRGWAEVWPTVERHWMPVVRGEAETADALRNMARELGG